MPPGGSAAHGLFGDIPIDRCPACGGAFFTFGTLDRLDDSVTIDAGALGYRGTSHGLALRCPGCRRIGYREEQEVARHDRVLASHPDAGVTARDRCLGFWLEEGGLDRLHLALLKLSSRRNVDLDVRARAETESEEEASPASNALLRRITATRY